MTTTTDTPKTITPLLQFTSAKLPKAVACALQDATVAQEGQEWVMLAPQMPRKSYEKFMQVVGALRGRWERQRHRFDYDPRGAIAQVLETGKIPQGNPGAFFPTPPDVVEHMLALIDFDDWFRPGPNMWVLEPSAGTGAIARVLRDRGVKHLECVELDPFNQAILEGQGFDVVGYDFLETGTPAGDRMGDNYDLIAMNPPFQGMQWAKHILKAYELLALGGKLVSVVPEAVFWRAGKELDRLRNLCAATGHIERLPDGSFEQSSTSVKTAVLSIQKMPEKWWDGMRAKRHEGYVNYWTWSACLALSCDRAWHDAPKRKDTLKPDMLMALGRIQQESSCLFYLDDQVIQATYEEQIEEFWGEGE